MPTWHFTPHPESDQLPIINLQANTSIDPKDVPFALARALQQLHALQVDQLHIYMIRFQLNEELIRLLTGALPYVAHLEMGWWVDGESTHTHRHTYRHTHKKTHTHAVQRCWHIAGPLQVHTGASDPRDMQPIYAPISK